MKESKLKILLVEDDNIARKLATVILTQLGCEVTEAVTGEQALSFTKELSFDVIFMDLGLPDMAGASVAATIRKNKSKNLNIPIVALTANDSPAYRKECREAGMSDFLAKPITEADATNILIKLNFK